MRAGLLSAIRRALGAAAAILAVLLVLPACADAAGTWSIQNPTTSSLTGVECPDTTTCRGVGAKGTIVETTDGGATWGTQASGITNNLNAISCRDASNCLVVGNKAGAGTNGAILATADGGATWSGRTSGTGNNLNGISCPDAGRCWAVGQNGTIVTSADGGTTWSIQTSGTTTQLNGISCSSTTTCVAVGNKGKDYAVVLTTTDAGATWTMRLPPTTQHLNEIVCTSATVCRAVGQGGVIVATTDGGVTWSTQASGTTSALIDLWCASDTICRVVGQSGTIRASNDGTTWSAQASGRTATLNAIDCVDATACWTVGATGTILATTDGGATWTPQTSGSNAALRDVSCIDTSTCWAVGNNGMITATTTAGASWLRQTAPTTKTIYGVTCMGAGTCYGVGAPDGTAKTGLVVKTVNGGATWSLQTSNTTKQLNDVACTSATTCWAVGQDGVIVTTTNGTTWATQASGVTKHLNAIECPASGTCYAVGALNGSYGVVLKTVNGGSTWSQQSSLVNQNLNGLACVDATTCWAVGQSGRLTKTANGSTWALQTSGTTENLNDVACGDTSICWAVGNNSGGGTPATIVTTTNGGSTWTPQASNTTHQLFGVTFIDTSYGFASGNAGTIAAYVDDSTPPDAPAIDAEPTSPGNVPSPSWSFTGEDGATFECRLDRGADEVAAWTPCDIDVTYALASEPDGAYTFSVRATDAAGNTGVAAESDYVLDTTLPVAPTLDSAPAAVVSTRTPSWSFSGEADASFECRLDNDNGQVFAWGPCTSATSYPLIAQPDGGYTFSVRASDGAGNIGPAATNSFTLDTVAPVAPAITASPASPDDGRSPSWSFTGEGGATLECRLDRGGTIVQAWTSCSGSEGYDLTALPDGTYRFSVRATDAAGNIGAVATSDYVLDDTDPAAPAITAAPGSPSLDENPSWSFSDEPGATYECSVDPDGAGASNWTSCSSPRTVDLSGEPDGDYVFSVRATDPAGNTGAAATSNYTLDRAALAAPTIDSQPPSAGSGRNPSWSFSAPSAAGYECRLVPGADPDWDWNPCTSAHSYDLTGAPDGTYTFSVRALDAINNESAATSDDYTLDTDSPGPPSFGPLPPSPGNDPQPTWSYTAEAGATFECELYRGATLLTSWSCGTTASTDLSARTDGTYTLSVRARDAAGNLGDPATADYVYDTDGPVTGITSSPATPRASRSPSWSFHAEDDAGYQCRLDRGGTTVAAWTTCTSPRSFDLTGQTDGTFTFSVRATDEAGNTGPISTSDYVLDTAAPAAPTVNSSPASPGAGRSPSWSFSGEGGASLRCRLDQGPDTIAGWASCTGVASYDLSGRPDATYTFSVQAIDSALNQSTVTTRDYTLDTAAPAQPAIDSSPPAAGSSTAPSWSFSAEGGSSTECRLDRGATTIVGWASCSGTRQYDLTGQGDGVYTFSVRATDAVGNVGAPRTSDYELVTTPPPAPAFVSQPLATGNSLNPAWGFTGALGTTFECRLQRGTTVLENWGACTTPKAVDLDGQPDGAYDLLVRTVNSVGLRSTPAQSRYMLDTSAPDAPVVTSAPGAIGANSTPAWQFSGEPGSTFQCRLERGATVVSGWSDCTSPRAFALVGQPDGDYDFLVRARDAAANPGAVTRNRYALLTSIPGSPRLTGAPAPIGRGVDPQWSFEGDAGVALECRLERDGGVVADWERCTSPRSYDLSDRPDGDYRFSVRTRNAAGTVGASTASAYFLDRVAPDRPTLQESPRPVGNDRRPTWAFAPQEGATFECRLNDRDESAWTGCVSPRAFSLRDRRDGDYVFELRATDSAGNVSPVRKDPYELDTRAPAAPKVVASPGATGADASPAWSFTGEAGASFDCLLQRTGTRRPGWDPCSSPKRYQLPEGGDYGFAVRATDRAGNAGASATSDYHLNVTAPAGGPAPAAAPPASPAEQGSAGLPDEDPAAAGPGPAAGPRGESASRGKRDGAGRRAASPSPAARAPQPPAPAGAERPPARPAAEPEKKSPVARAIDTVGRTIEQAAEVVTDNADKSVFPLSVVLLVGVFLVIQGRIDRNDPKLALAPVQADVEVPFGSPLKLRRPPGAPHDEAVGVR